MNDITTETVLNMLLGFVGGIITIPFGAFFTYLLKREELSYKYKLDVEAKKKELLLQHELEMISKQKDNAELSMLMARLERLEQIVGEK